MKISRALVSVHDKTGIVDFVRGLHALGVEVCSTGGTARLLRDAGVPVRDVSEVTGFPEMLDGRVKTLHPKIHGGILARRDSPEHLATLERHGIPRIDLVVVSLYPFEATVARSGVSAADVIAEIDVGGPTMIRAAAKNHAGVAVVTDISQYAAVLEELRASGGALSEATRRGLAREAFRRTAAYDAAIAEYFQVGGCETHPQLPPFHVSIEPEARSVRQLPTPQLPPCQAAIELRARARPRTPTRRSRARSFPSACSSSSSG